MNQNSLDIENKEFDTFSFLEFLGCEISEELPEMVRTRVIPSFLSISKRYRFETFNEDALRIWFVSMVLGGMKFNQAKRYVGTLHTLFTSWNTDKHVDDPFIKLIADLSESKSFDAKRETSNRVAIRRLVGKNPDKDTIITRNAFLYLLYNPTIDFNELVRLPLGSAKCDCPQIQDVIDSTPRKPRATYVFPLNQGNTTDRKAITILQNDMRLLLKAEGVVFENDFSRDSIKSLWIANALQCGIDIPSIRGIVEELPKEYEILSLVTPLTLTENAKNRIICKVANHVNDTTVKWFIMQMRKKVTPENIKDEIKDIDEAVFKEMDFYYPTSRAVQKDKKGKRKVVEVPYLPGILFIRLRSDKVENIASRVTKYAWCYRYSRNPDSPYSSMTQKQMEKFQIHIGRLTPDIRMTLVERLQPLENNTEVRITGGDLMEGQVGRITSVRNINGTRTYSLEITNTLSAKWTVDDIDEVFLEPVKDN